MQTGEKTHQRMLPQFAALESVPADNPRSGTKRGSDAQATGLCQGRGEIGRGLDTAAGVTPLRVFVVDVRGNPLMPCEPARARQMLAKGRAVVVCRAPFTIRLKDRKADECQFQPIRLGVDPGSRTTGMAVSRDDGGVRHVLARVEIEHRSKVIYKRMQQRSAYRRRRRTANLRYRAPRFLNRTKPGGWLAPSLRSRVEHVQGWVARLARVCPVSVVDLELVRFDMQKMMNPEISGVEYQRGELAGFEVREYLLAKFDRRCVYCDAENVPLNIDHIRPRSRGGSDRVSNLALACIPCNQAKGSQPVEVFAPDRAARILAWAKAPLRDAAAVNSVRFATLAAIQDLGVPVECGTGGRTKWNRSQFGVPKGHALDAACVGGMAGITGWGGSTLTFKATGRGSYSRTTPDRYGFPRLRRPRSKTVHGFATGDLVVATPTKGKFAGERIVGRVAVRTTGSFRVGKSDPISWRYCTMLSRSNGWESGLRPEPPIPPGPEGPGFPAAKG
jgi:hypothetical protein